MSSFLANFFFFSKKREKLHLNSCDSTSLGVCVGAGMCLINGSKKSPAVFQITYFSTSVTIFLWVLLALRWLKNQILKEKNVFVTHSHTQAENMWMLSVFSNCQKINAVGIRAINVGTLTAEPRTLPRHLCTSCVDYTWLYTWNVASI